MRATFGLQGLCAHSRMAWRKKALNLIDYIFFSKFEEPWRKLPGRLVVADSLTTIIVFKPVVESLIRDDHASLGEAKGPKPFARVLILPWVCACVCFFSCFFNHTETEQPAWHRPPCQVRRF